MDGMDPALTRKFMSEGLMPNCQRLTGQGSFLPLRTTDPPQSPVAWSSFISGTNPGGHGIFDFIARDPQNLSLHFSTSRVRPSGRAISIGGWSLPISRGAAENLRKGHTLWAILQQEGIPCTVVRIPANFPPTDTRARTLSGMGTPDLQGTYGTFTYYTADGAFPALQGMPRREVAGGTIERTTLNSGVARCVLRGPVNHLRADARPAEIPFTVFVDGLNGLAKIVVQNQEFILKEGEWSPWITVRFSLVSHLAGAPGICRFYLKEARRSLGLYVSPVNIDPADPALPISTPASHSRQLADRLGRFHTQGIAEDTAALSSGVFDDAEFRQQSTHVFEEALRHYDDELARFSRGFLFFYFSSLDLNSHVFWRTLDPQHPFHSPEQASAHGDFLPWLYTRMDTAIGKAMAQANDRTLLLVISDHGFSSFRRAFHLNTWLARNGYAALKDPYAFGETELFRDVDWGRTQAYGLGLNGLYLNLQGREGHGTVSPGDAAQALKKELVERLTGIRDPATGEAVVANVYCREDIYSGPHVEAAPDLIVACNRHHRISKESALGGYPERDLEDNLSPWTGDHCMDGSFLPGVCLSNRSMAQGRPALWDLAPTLLNAFGLPVPEGMTGRDVFQ
jgi:predicted AlkP superfamily phosphohydrolase/phosphomutase